MAQTNQNQSIKVLFSQTFECTKLLINNKKGKMQKLSCILYFSYN